MMFRGIYQIAERSAVPLGSTIALMGFISQHNEFPTSARCSSQRTFTSVVQGPVKVGFLTDLEGDRFYWNQFIRQSRVLEEGDTADSPPNLKDGCHFVFGGDIVDKGGHDLLCLRDLLSLKKRYPDRVHLLMGNRDINKMRLAHELCPKRLNEEHPGVYWVKGKTPADLKDDLPDMPEIARRALWMLRATMGCPDTFELRRQELAKLNGKGVEEVSDEAVAMDMVRSVLPGGEMNEYLSSSQLALQINDLLFLHGACWNGSMGIVPDLNGKHESVDGGVTEWISALNQFAEEQVAEFNSGCADGCGDGTVKTADKPWAKVGGWRGDKGAALLQYGMGLGPGRTALPTVVYANYLKAGNPAYIADEVVGYLKQNGISTVVSGHQPHGDAPVVISHDGVRVVTADLSYSNNVIWEEDPGRKAAKAHNTHPSPENGNGQRGKAVAEVYFENDGDGRPTRTSIHGKLSTGEGYSFELPPPSEKRERAGPGAVGHQTDDGWWVKGVMYDGKLLATKAEGFQVTNRIIDPKK